MDFNFNIQQQFQQETLKAEETVYEILKLFHLQHPDVIHNFFIREVLSSYNKAKLKDISDSVEYFKVQLSKEGDASAAPVKENIPYDSSTVSNSVTLQVSSSKKKQVGKRKQLEKPEQPLLPSSSNKRSKNVEKKKITEDQYLEFIGPNELSSAIYEAPLPNEVENPTRYDLTINGKKPKTACNGIMSNNVNFIGNSSRSFGPNQDKIKIVDNFSTKCFSNVSNRDTSFYITAEVSKDIFNGLKISTCGKEVYNQATGIQLQSEDGKVYISFPLGIGSSKPNTYLEFTATSVSTSSFKFYSPIFDSSSTAIDSQSLTKNFFKRQNLKLFLKFVDSLQLFPTEFSVSSSSSSVAESPLCSYLLTPSEVYDKSNYSLISLILAASAIPTSTQENIKAKLILIDEQDSQHIISWGEGHFGEHLIICNNAVITSPLLIKKGIYRVGFYYADKKKVQFIINLYNNTVSLNSSVAFYSSSPSFEENDSPSDNSSTVEISSPPVSDISTELSSPPVSDITTEFSSPPLDQNDSLSPNDFFTSPPQYQQLQNIVTVPEDFGDVSNDDYLSPPLLPSNETIIPQQSLPLFISQNFFNQDETLYNLNNTGSFLFGDQYPFEQ